MTAVWSQTPRSGRVAELGLSVFAVVIIAVAYLSAQGGAAEGSPAGVPIIVLVALAMVLAFHAVVRWRATYADPVLLPTVTLLNGLGIVMIYRLDIAAGRDWTDGYAIRQTILTILSITGAAAVLVFLRDHRVLRRYTFTFALAGLILLLLPLAPGIGQTENGSRLWLNIAGVTFQPGELAKIALSIFFAGYLVSTRDALSVAGRKVLGFTFPRGRDLGPILVAWLISLGVLVLERDLGSSLLFFGLFVAMLYLATERISWVVIGLGLFAGGAYVAYLLFGHVRDRFELWLHPFADAAISDQVARGLMGMASGGMIGTGLGQGRPYLTPHPASDYIIPSFGEELGLIGLFAIYLLYAVIVERGLRTGIGVRDGFGKLLAAGLAFSIGMQVFVIVGGVTRVIPLTGLTTPFLSYGGTSLVANWILIALLLRISDQARRPIPPAPPAGAGVDETQLVARI